MSTISNSWTGMTTLASGQLGTVPAKNEDLAVAPASLLPDTFRSWTLEKQDAYLTRHGSPLTLGTAVTSRPLDVKRSGEPALTLTMKTAKFLNGAADGFTFRDVTAETGMVSRPTDFSLPPASLPPSSFLSWTREERLRYAQANGFGAIGGSTTIGSATNQGTLLVGVVDDIVMESGPVYGNSAATGGSAGIPYYHLNGSTDGMPSQTVRDQADKLFPTIDGEKHTLDAADRPKSIYKETNDPADPRPLRPDAEQKGFYTNPGRLTTEAQAQAFMKDFVTWHSGYQLEFVKLHGSGDPTRLVIPAGSATPVLAAMVSQTDKTQLYILSSLDKAAFAKMSLADQTAIATLPGFAAVANQVGLKAKDTSGARITDLTSPSGDAVAPDVAASNLKAFINSKISTKSPGELQGRIVTLSQTNPQTAEDRAANIYYVGPTAVTPATNPASYSWEKRERLPTAEHRSYFTSQIDVLTTQLSTMAIVSPAEITNRLKALKDRFDRAYAFCDVAIQTPVTGFMGVPATNATMYKDVISLDDNKTIAKGYQVFIAQEKRLAETMQERSRVASNDGALYGRRLDVPELVFRLQSLYNIQLEAEVVMETEEVSQQNALLQTYAKMQDIVNETLSRFGRPTKTASISSARASTTFGTTKATSRTINARSYPCSRPSSANSRSTRSKSCARSTGRCTTRSRSSTTPTPISAAAAATTTITSTPSLIRSGRASAPACPRR